MQARACTCYDEKLFERNQLIFNLDVKKVYYDLSEQGKLREALEKMHSIVVEDIMNDLRELNNLEDHLSALRIHFLITNYFFGMSLRTQLL